MDDQRKRYADALTTAMAILEDMESASGGNDWIALPPDFDEQMEELRPVNHEANKALAPYRGL